MVRQIKEPPKIPAVLPHGPLPEQPPEPDDLAELEATTDGAMSDQDKLAMIRAAYDNVTKDIGIVEAKKDCKREEMKVLEVRSQITALEQANIPPSEGQVIMN